MWLAPSFSSGQRPLALDLGLNLCRLVSSGQVQATGTDLLCPQLPPYLGFILPNQNDFQILFPDLVSSFCPKNVNITELLFNLDKLFEKHWETQGRGSSKASHPQGRREGVSLLTSLGASTSEEDRAT